MIARGERDLPPRCEVSQSYHADTGDRVIVSLTTALGRIVLDISPAAHGQAIDVEAYTYDQRRGRITHRVWTEGRFGPLEPGQVASYGIRELTDAEKAAAR